ncbi:MAG: hypothetical protein ACI4XE_10705 [Acutalibacteraceae bacterium]
MQMLPPPATSAFLIAFYRMACLALCFSCFGAVSIICGYIAPAITFRLSGVEGFLADSSHVVILKNITANEKTQPWLIDNICCGIYNYFWVFM